MTLRDVAHELGGIPLEHVEVTLTFKTNVMPSGDPNALDLSRQLRIASIRRAIKLIGPLSPSQRQILMAEAAHCPVHNTLSPAVRIHDVEVPSSS